ncbi:MAG: hypothetical protein RL392_2429, partial [Pseudomonadota bacterium]
LGLSNIQDRTKTVKKPLDEQIVFQQTAAAAPLEFA